MSEGNMKTFKIRATWTLKEYWVELEVLAACIIHITKPIFNGKKVIKFPTSLTFPHNIKVAFCSSYCS